MIYIYTMKFGVKNIYIFAHQGFIYLIKSTVKP